MRYAVTRSRGLPDTSSACAFAGSRCLRGPRASGSCAGRFAQWHQGWLNLRRGASSRIAPGAPCWKLVRRGARVSSDSGAGRHARASRRLPPPRSAAEAAAETAVMAWIRVASAHRRHPPAPPGSKKAVSAQSHIAAGREGGAAADRRAVDHRDVGGRRVERRNVAQRVAGATGACASARARDRHRCEMPPARAAPRCARCRRRRAASCPASSSSIT